MAKGKSSRIKFDEFAEFFGITPAKLFEDLKAHNNSSEGSAKLSSKAVQVMKSKGVSFRNAATTEFLMDFAAKKFPNDQELPLRMADAFLSDLGAKNSDISLPFPREVLDAEPELVDALAAMLMIRGDGDELQSERTQYAGHYHLVRKTSRPDTGLYYEEPFRIGAKGNGSYLIPHEQGVNIGFSFASKGICTTLLFHRHQTRTLGARMIMLFGNATPRKTAMTGVMLRFSDDQYRPVASQVLARRALQEDVTSHWDDKVTAAQAADLTDPNSEAATELTDSLNSLTSKISIDNDPDSLFEIYEAFELKYHAKAFDKPEWDKALGKVNLTDEELVNRLKK